MSGNFTIGLLQLNSQEHFEENVSLTLSLIREAAELGADFVMTPEMTDFYEPDLNQVEEKSYTESSSQGDHIGCPCSGVVPSRTEVLCSRRHRSDPIPVIVEHTDTRPS